MSRHFSIPTVLRMTPNRWLKLFFQRIGAVLIDVSWDDLREREIVPVVNEIRKLPQNQQDVVERSLQNLFDLSCEQGVNAILEAARLLDLPNFAAELPDRSYYEKSMWVWLNCLPVFEQAVMIHQVDRLGRWKKRKDLPRVAAQSSDQAQRQLASEISRLLSSEQGRGKRCSIEYLRRCDAEYFIAYSDDFIHTMLAHDKQNQLASIALRPAFEIVFAYSQNDGSLELYAKTPTRLKPMLEEAFINIILQAKARRLDCAPTYNLNRLKDRHCVMQVDPTDGVVVRVRRMRLAIRGSQRRIVLEADRLGAIDDIYVMLHECLNEEHVPLSGVDITSARLSFEFQPVNGRQPGVMTFDVGWPDTCSLRNERYERICMALKYLKRWGITCE